MRPVRPVGWTRFDVAPQLAAFDGPRFAAGRIRQFRQWGCIAPGHSERGLIPGAETTTDPLGQGFGNGVGLAIADAHLAARYNRPGFELINHFTYALVSDGDLTEGVAAEAGSLAGHLKLGRLIYRYDDNRIALAASTQLTFTGDHAKRFAAYGRHTQSVKGGKDLEAIDRAIRAARQETDLPPLLLVRTHIGYGSPDKQDTFADHGSPPGEEEVKLTNTVAKVEGWREKFPLAAENALRTRPRDEEAQKDEQIKKLGVGAASRSLKPSCRAAIQRLWSTR